MSAVSPRRSSRAFTTAPASMSSRTAFGSPVRAAAISTVSPSLITVFASAPAFRRISTRSRFALPAASDSGETPYRLTAFTFAPAAINCFAVSISSPRTAQSSGVVPSFSAMLTADLPAVLARILWTASWLPVLTASTSVSSVPPTREERTRTPSRPTLLGSARFFIIDIADRGPQRPALRKLRKQFNRRVAVAELLHLMAELVRDREPQVANRRPRRQLDVTVALAHTTADANHRQRIGEVSV